MHRVQVLAGVHYEGRIHPDGRPVLGDDGQQLLIEFRAPDVFETDQDLAERWPEKFRRVHDVEITHGTPVDPVSLAARQGATPTETDRPLDGLSVKELRALAAEQEVEVADNANREQIVAALRRRAATRK